MTGRAMEQQAGIPPRGLAEHVAQVVHEGLADPRHLAEEFLREHLPCRGALLGEGTADCPWLAFGGERDFYAFYMRGRELVNIVRGGHEREVCVV